MGSNAGGSVFGQGWALPPFSWWALLPYALIVLMLVLYVLGYLRGRGRRPGADMPQQQSDPADQVSKAERASNDDPGADRRRAS
ncbi:MAG: hypothetical protein EPO01_09760 [Aquabacterium sp.]|nr:MAG: hypothetical protein EPO01_09760 [Aquabacterium sp.]